MDLALSHGYFLSEDPAEQRIMKPYPPLGILYISAYLKQRGYDVRVFDSTFHSLPEFCSWIDREKPSVVGLYSNLMTKLNVIRQIAYCKQKGCTVIAGGPDVPVYAEEYVSAGADVAVTGEGEETMAELLPALIKNSPLAGIPGIVYRNGDDTITRSAPRPLITDLDGLPLPDRESIDLQRYISTWRRYHRMGSLSLICARGCPFTCTWCSRSVYGETHRRRSPAHVVSEIELLLEQYHPDMLWFADDVFTINHKWFHDFYSEMKRRRIRIPFECISRADRLNEEILSKMADLGSFRIWYGSESGSQRILDAMRRRVSVDEIRHVARLAKGFGIQTGLFVMLGYPGEETEDIDITADHLKKTGADLFLTTVAYPIKGTEYYKEVEHEIYTPENWSRSTDRSLRYSGRHSDRFYWFANRFLMNEVNHHRMRNNGAPHRGKLVSSFVKSKLARLGMEMTKWQGS